MQKVHKDVAIAKSYATKAKGAKDRGHDFTLSFAQYKKLRNTRVCFYTGVDITPSLTERPQGSSHTLDRVDCSRGYVPGNVVACCHSANSLKSSWENQFNGMNLAMAKQIVAKINEDGSPIFD